MNHSDGDDRRNARAASKNASGFGPRIALEVALAIIPALASVAPSGSGQTRRADTVFAAAELTQARPRGDRSERPGTTAEVRHREYQDTDNCGRTLSSWPPVTAASAEGLSYTKWCGRVVRAVYGGRSTNRSATKFRSGRFASHCLGGYLELTIARFAIGDLGSSEPAGGNTNRRRHLAPGGPYTRRPAHNTRRSGAANRNVVVEDCARSQSSGRRTMARRDAHWGTDHGHAALRLGLQAVAAQRRSRQSEGSSLGRERARGR